MPVAVRDTRAPAGAPPSGHGLDSWLHDRRVEVGGVLVLGVAGYAYYRKRKAAAAATTTATPAATGAVGTSQAAGGLPAAYTDSSSSYDSLSQQLQSLQAAIGGVQAGQAQPGPTGLAGVQGPQGDPGAAGAQGAPGAGGAGLVSASVLPNGPSGVSNIVEALPSPEGTGGYYIGSDGGVFAMGGAPFYGSYPGLPASDKGGGARNFIGAYFDPAGGYTLVSNRGEDYHFGP